MQNAHSSHRGFTMIELLVVLAMVAIGVTLALPGFHATSARNYIASPKKALRNTLATARTEAVTRSIPAIVCASNDQNSCGNDWSKGWIAFLDMNDNDAYDDGTDEKLAVRPALSPSVVLTYSQGSSLKFTRDGYLGGAAGDFVFCYTEEADPANPLFARALLVGLSGVVRNSVDADNSGVHEDSNGDISC